jgi:hypothetical protein
MHHASINICQDMSMKRADTALRVHDSWHRSLWSWRSDRMHVPWWSSPSFMACFLLRVQVQGNNLELSRLVKLLQGRNFLLTSYFIILSNAYMQIERLIEIIGAWASITSIIYEPDRSAVMLVRSRATSWMNLVRLPCHRASMQWSFGHPT